MKKVIVAACFLCTASSALASDMNYKDGQWEGWVNLDKGTCLAGKPVSMNVSFIMEEYGDEFSIGASVRHHQKEPSGKTATIAVTFDGGQPILLSGYVGPEDDNGTDTVLLPAKSPQEIKKLIRESAVLRMSSDDGWEAEVNLMGAKKAVDWLDKCYQAQSTQ